MKPIKVWSYRLNRWATKRKANFKVYKYPKAAYKHLSKHILDLKYRTVPPYYCEQSEVDAFEELGIKLGLTPKQSVITRIKRKVWK